MIFYKDLGSFHDKIALIDENENTLTYNELKIQAEKLAKIFSGSDNKKLIFIYCKNNFESIISYIASLISNNTCLLLNSDLNQELSEKLISIYKPDYIVEPFSGSPSEDIFTFMTYAVRSKSYQHKTKLNNELALLLSTSGSTGSPKLVRLSFNNLNANTNSIVKYLKLKDTDTAITTLPMNYTYGLSIINTELAVGATIVLTNHSIVTKEFWNLLKKYKCTSIAGVPYTYEILKKLKFMEMDLPYLKVLTQAGGKLNPALAKEFSEYSKNQSKKFFVMYGQTEATARMGYMPSDIFLVKPTAMGIAIPDGKFCIIDIKDNKINEPDIEGELVYVGKNVMMGYAENRQDLELGNIMNNRLVTGDMAKFDKDGYYYITGRKKRFIKLFGSRVNLDEVERFLRSKKYDCAVGGRDDMLMIAVTEDHLADEIKNILIDIYNFAYSAIKVILVNEITKNDSGKFQYNMIFKNVIK